MEITKHAAYLLYPTARPCLCHTPCTIASYHVPFLIQHLTQCTAINKIHHQIVLPTLDKEVTHARYAGMIEVKQQCRLAFKPIDRLRAFTVTLKFVQHLLYCTGTIEACI